MSDHRHIIGAVCVFFGIVLVGGGALAWPSHRETRAIERQIADLRDRIESLDARMAEVAMLEQQREVVTRKVQQDLKPLPDAPNLAELMRRLSLRADGETVVDQTFTAGRAFEPLNSDELPPSKAGAPAAATPMAMPLNVDLVGTFDSVFSLIRAAESMDRLVRISTLRINCERNERNRPRHYPLLSASIGLEAVYIAAE